MSKQPSSKGWQGVSVLAISISLVPLTVPMVASAAATPIAAVEQTSTTTATGSGNTNPAAADSARAGAPPTFVQDPYLKKRNDGTVVVKASVYLDPFKRSTPAKYAKKALADRVSFRLRVAKAKYSKADSARTVALLRRAALITKNNRSYTVNKKGVLAASIQLPKDAADKLLKRDFQGRRSALALSVVHLKDTAKDSAQAAPKWGLQQVTPTTLVKGKYPDALINKRTQFARKMVADLRNGSSASVSGSGSAYTSSSTYIGDSGYYNWFSIRNNTPFQQSVSMNPNIQCMWTGANPNGAQPVAPSITVAPQASTTFAYYWVDDRSKFAGVRGATSGMKPPAGSDADNVLGELSAAGTKTLRSALKLAVSPSTYSAPGLAKAAATIGLTFGMRFLQARSKDNCGNTTAFPQLFGVSTQVVGFGSKSDQLVARDAVGTYPPSDTWAGLRHWPDSSSAYGVNAGADHEGPLAVDGDWAELHLQPLLGAQTLSTYYWNGGQSAPMNVPGANQGGSATFTGGLIQYFGPNPGVPGFIDKNAACYGRWGNQPHAVSCDYSRGDPTVGTSDIQLSFLTNPAGTENGLSNQGKSTTFGKPVFSALHPTDSPTDTKMTCDLTPITPTLALPFGSGTNKSSYAMGTGLTRTGFDPWDGRFIVSWYAMGIDPKTGEEALVYHNDVDRDGNPTENWADNAEPDSNGRYEIPTLGMNTGGSDVTFAQVEAGGDGAKPYTTLTKTRLNELFTADGDRPDSITRLGCGVTASLQLPALDVTPWSPTGGKFGAIRDGDEGWPFSYHARGTNSPAGWPAVAFPGKKNPSTDYKWQKPVEQINVTFQGVPTSDDNAPPSPLR